ncbi:MAG TPA: manganese catalase family protein [Thermomicrobiales bacterium]|jgi:Mn-containing catalase|nr:manganese catalase family protein [Thermomicrobiales bacterium]
MFFHVKELQFDARPERPDPVYAKRLQELLGGQMGEMTVMMSYLMQGWNCRGPQKYKDMLLDIGTEEIAHVEMLSSMIGRLLENAPVKMQDEAAAASPVVEAAMGAMGGSTVQDAIFAAMNPQHEIVSGQGATLKDSVGVPWNGGYIAASGNLLADFRFNLMAESQGNLQAARLYEMTDDAGVRRMLSFNLARDIMHQNQWQAAIDDLRAEGIEEFVVPGTLPMERVMTSQSGTFWNMSQGTESQQGAWASGPRPDGQGEFTYLADPAPLTTDNGDLPPSDPRLHGTQKQPMPPVSSGGPNPNPDR